MVEGLCLTTRQVCRAHRLPPRGRGRAPRLASHDDAAVLEDPMHEADTRGEAAASGQPCLLLQGRAQRHSGSLVPSVKQGGGLRELFCCDACPQFPADPQQLALVLLEDLLPLCVLWGHRRRSDPTSRQAVRKLPLGAFRRSYEERASQTKAIVRVVLALDRPSSRSIAEHCLASRNAYLVADVVLPNALQVVKQGSQCNFELRAHTASLSSNHCSKTTGACN
mmetsp:Transcript_69039/g.223910  ORF Transcript_69039/g.223910 Transcript_69039/m.223910 type:complete len:223 (-) Transcript_69039:303-971(-)